MIAALARPVPACWASWIASKAAAAADEAKSKADGQKHYGAEASVAIVELPGAVVVKIRVDHLSPTMSK